MKARHPFRLMPARRQPPAALSGEGPQNGTRDSDKGFMAFTDGNKAPMKRGTARLRTLLLLTGFYSVVQGQSIEPEALFSETYTVHFVQGASVRLHCLDWGGDGDPLILVHGLGDTPYIFEGLANALKDRFRVIAYSRRGHGQSESLDGRYDGDAQLSDLVLLMDSLHIARANLLGWSMGGNDITEFAIRYPGRTNRLIYLEGGYDLSEEPFGTLLRSLPVSPFADSVSLASLDVYRSWYHRFWYPDIEWNAALEKNLQASIATGPDHRLRTIPDDSVTQITFRSAMAYRRTYGKVSAPALVIFTRRFFSAPAGDTALASAYAGLEKEIIDPWRRHSMNRVKSELKNATVVELTGGSHTSLIFTNKDELVQNILSFLND